MKKALLPILLFPVFAFADEDASSPLTLADVDYSMKVSVSDPIKWSSDYCDGCQTYRICTTSEFEKSGEDIYWHWKQDYRQYRFEPNDIPEYHCTGEPGDAEVIFYVLDVHQLTEIGKIVGNDCILRIGKPSNYKGRRIIPTVCRYSGTGAFFQEKYYVVDGDNISEIGQKNLSLPHELFGMESFKFNDDRIELGSGRHPRYCQCVESFSVQLDIESTEDGGYNFVYIEGTYRPYFRSQSNARNRSGLEAFGSGDYAIAVEAFREAVELDVANYEAFTNLGLAHLKINEFDQAIETSGYAYEHGDSSHKANAAFNLGMAHEAMQDYESALFYYTAAAAEAPTKVRKLAMTRVEAAILESEDE